MEVAPAREHLEQGITRYDPQQHRSLAFLYGQDPGVGCRCFAALSPVVSWVSGPGPEDHEALTLAQELAHPLSLVYALIFAARLHQIGGRGN